MTTLRERCRLVHRKMQQDAILREGNPVDRLVEFVLVERGRVADESLEETLPLVLYFGSESEREEFMAIVREAKPGMVTKAMP